MQEFATRQREWRKTLALSFAGLLLFLLTIASVYSGSYQLLAPIITIAGLAIGFSMHEAAPLTRQGDETAIAGLKPDVPPSRR